LEAWPVVTHDEENQPREEEGSEAGHEGGSMFGRVALQMNLLSREQVNRCLRLQGEWVEKGERKTLGAIASELGFLRPEQSERIAIIQAFLEARNADRRFGEIAVANGFMTRDQLLDALKVQKKGFKKGAEIRRIGQILVDLRYLTHQQRDAVLQAQRRLHEE
jgi:hypothetical protein